MFNKKIISILLLMTAVVGVSVLSQKSKPSNIRVLMVLTNTSTLGNTGQKTGFHFSEATHPHYVFTRANFEVDFVSPKGGEAPPYYVDLEDRINLAFFLNPLNMTKVKTTFNPSQINPAKYDAIFYVGGPGAMWDFPNNQQLAQITATIYEKGGLVAAICHGPAGLVNVKLSNGNYLVAGKTVTSFSNEEEESVDLTKVVPFLLETKLIERGGKFVEAPLYQPKVAVSGRLVTGQNPASAKEMSKRIVDILQKPQLRPES